METYWHTQSDAPENFTRLLPRKGMETLQIDRFHSQRIGCFTRLLPRKGMETRDTCRTLYVQLYKTASPKGDGNVGKNGIAKTKVTLQDCFPERGWKPCSKIWEPTIHSFTRLLPRKGMETFR